MSLTTFKDFRIGACIAEISMYWKLPFGLKNPVAEAVTDLDGDGGVCVPDVGGADLRSGEAAVANVAHQGAVGGVDVRAQAETMSE